MARHSPGLTESSLLYKTSCDNCGSSDANGVYDDGHTYCHKCESYGRADGDEEAPPPPAKGQRMEGLIRGSVEAIPNRKLDDRVCEKYNYQVGTFKDKKCHIAPYYDEAGTVVAQQIRLPGKDFPILGDLKKALPLWGQQLLRDGGKMVVITEGQLDAMSVTQAMGLSWPAVSLPNGAKSAKKAIARALGTLETFEKVVLCFDEDADGREAVEDVAGMFSPGKVFVTKLPVKDANDMVKAGRSKELVDAIWGARKWSPDVLNDIDDDLIDDACEEQGWGLPWPWVTMTKATYGILRGCLYTWGAGTGSGKTTLMRMLMATAMRPEMGEHHDFLPMPAPRPVGTILYEEPLKRTLKNLAGLVMRQRIHVPGVEYDKDEAKRIMRELRPLLKSVALKGARNWDTVKTTIRFLHASEGVEDFVIDPMTALTAGAENERQELDGIMSELAELAEELDITIHLVFHLATPEGKSHEDGGRVQEKHFRGSRAVAFWSHFLMGLERNKQDPDCPTIIRGLKDRPTGDAVGPFIALTYDKDSGHMVEVPMPEGDGKPFKDETDNEL